MYCTKFVTRPIIGPTTMMKEDEQKKNRKTRGDQKEIKHNKAASKTQRERKDHKLLPESPPLEIGVSATDSPYRPTNVPTGGEG